MSRADRAIKTNSYTAKSSAHIDRGHFTKPLLASVDRSNWTRDPLPGSDHIHEQSGSAHGQTPRRNNRADHLCTGTAGAAPGVGGVRNFEGKPGIPTFGPILRAKLKMGIQTKQAMLPQAEQSKLPSCSRDRLHPDGSTRVIGQHLWPLITGALAPNSFRNHPAWGWRRRRCG
jgi:hypothetical protein